MRPPEHVAECMVYGNARSFGHGNPKEPDFYDRVGYPEEGPQHGWGLEGNRINVEDIFYKRFSRGGLPQNVVEYKFYKNARGPRHTGVRGL